METYFKWKLAQEFIILGILLLCLFVVLLVLFWIKIGEPVLNRFKKIRGKEKLVIYILAVMSLIVFLISRL